MIKNYHSSKIRNTQHLKLWVLLPIAENYTVKSTSFLDKNRNWFDGINMYSKQFLFILYSRQIYYFFDLSPVQDFMWLVNPPFDMKPLLQSWQIYGLSPVCILVCIRKAVLWLKHFPQYLQANGFSLVCTRTWSSSNCFVRKRFSQKLQAKGLSPVCVL